MWESNASLLKQPPFEKRSKNIKFSHFKILYLSGVLTLNPFLAKHDMPILANSVDPDQLASEAN